MTPKPLVECTPKRLPERPKRMTLIGSFTCPNGVVLFADRQESITDYAKWDVGKIKHAELSDTYRILMAGAGDSNTIDMTWSIVLSKWRQGLHNGLFSDASALKDFIYREVVKVTKQCIIPYPSKDRPWIDLIWVIQKLGPRQDLDPMMWNRIETFRTHGLTILPTGMFCVGGNPIFLMHYLEDLFISHHIINLEDAEALAAYLLWEAKEYDPTCGKHSDVFVMREDDGNIGRMTLAEERYWEEHFEYLKKSLSLIPLLSCASELTKQIYKPKDQLARFMTTMRTLSKEQEKIRKKQIKPRSDLETRLMRNLRKTAQKYNKT